MKIEIYNQFTHNGFINAMVSFIPDININCNPPYIKGKRIVAGLNTDQEINQKQRANWKK